MALSGTKFMDFNYEGGNFRYGYEWAVTQFPVSKKNRIKIDTYFQSLNSSSVLDLRSKNVNTKMYFANQLYNWDSKILVSPNEKRYVNEQIIDLTGAVIDPNSGNWTVPLETTFAIDTTVLAHIEETLYINPIPKRSTGTATDFMILNPFSFSISKEVNSFTHDITILIGNNILSTWTDQSTGGSISLTDTEISRAINLIGNASLSAKYTIKIITKSSEGIVGEYITPEKTISKPSIPMVSSPNWDLTNNGTVFTISNFYSDPRISYSISWEMYGFKHKTITGIKESKYNMKFSDSELSEMIQNVGAGKTGEGNAVVTGFFNTTQFTSLIKSNSIGVTVIESNLTKPQIIKEFSYSDQNTVVRDLIGSSAINPKNMVQGESSIVLTTPPNFASGQLGAGIKSMKATVFGELPAEFPQYNNAQGITSVIGRPLKSGMTSILVEITDTRGFKATAIKEFNVVPYKPRKIIDVKLERKNKVEKTTQITITGLRYPIIVDGIDKNIVNPQVDLMFRYIVDDQGGQSWHWENVSGIPMSIDKDGNFKGEYTMDFPNEKQQLEFYLEDRLGATSMRDIILESGVPIVFIDKDKMSMGVGMFPENKNSLEVNGLIRATKGFISNEIFPGEDLNNFTTPGFFYSPSNANAKQILNTPVGEAFSLLVEKHAGYKQTFTTYNANTNMRTYVRNYYYASGWSPWYINGQPIISKTGHGIGWGTTADLVRTGNMVFITVNRQIRTWSLAGQDSALGEKIPTGYTPIYHTTMTVNRNSSNTVNAPLLLHIYNNGRLTFTNHVTGANVCSGGISYITNDPFPSA